MLIKDWPTKDSVGGGGSSCGVELGGTYIGGQFGEGYIGGPFGEGYIGGQFWEGYIGGQFAISLYTGYMAGMVLLLAFELGNSTLLFNLFAPCFLACSKF